MHQDRPDQIMHLLRDLHVDLCDDPTVMGYHYIATKTGAVRNMANIAQQVRLEIANEQRILDRQLRARKASYKIAFGQVLLSDAVKRLPSYKDREAAAEDILKQDLSEINTMVDELAGLEALATAAAMVHSDLSKTASEIRTQAEMVRRDRASGAGFGNETSVPEPKSTVDLSSFEKVIEEELNKSIAD